MAIHFAIMAFRGILSISDVVKFSVKLLKLYWPSFIVFKRTNVVRQFPISANFSSIGSSVNGNDTMQAYHPHFSLIVLNIK